MRCWAGHSAASARSNVAVIAGDQAAGALVADEPWGEAGADGRRGCPPVRITRPPASTTSTPTTRSSTFP